MHVLTCAQWQGLAVAADWHALFEAVAGSAFSGRVNVASPTSAVLSLQTFGRLHALHEGARALPELGSCDITVLLGSARMSVACPARPYAAHSSVH